jgi:chaperonin GroEL (HSP60 family)
LIADALSKVGKEGVISLEEGKGIVTELEITEGMKLEKVLSHLISLRIQKNGSFIRQSIHSSNG